MADPTAPQATSLFGVPVAPQAAPVAPPQRYVERDGKHRGVAGVARDILGTLGDFLLTRLRMPAMYAPAQRARKLAAAQEGYDTDPLGAINRVTSVDPVFGAKLRDQYIDNQRLKAGQESTVEAREARLQAAQTVQNDRTRNRAAAMLGTMATWDDPRRATNYAALREQIIRYGNANGLDLSNELPTQFDPIQLDSFIDGAVPVGTQRAQRLTRERMDRQQDQFEQRDETIRRGQDIGSGDRAASRDVTRRGQDIGSADRRRGQDIGSADRRRGQDIGSQDRAADRQERSRHNRRMEERPGRFTPDPNRIYVQNGRRFRYNAQTKTYELVN